MPTNNKTQGMELGIEMVAGPTKDGKVKIGLSLVMSPKDAVAYAKAIVMAADKASRQSSRVVVATQMPPRKLH